MKINIDEKRKQRYKDKIELATKRLQKIEEIFPNFKDETIRLAVYEAFQELIEILTDISAMLLIDDKKSLGDDYLNIEKVGEVINLTDEEIAILKEANGLRNRVVHEYNKTNNETAKESINKLLPELEKIINKFENFIEKNAKAKN